MTDNSYKIKQLRIVKLMMKNPKEFGFNDVNIIIEDLNKQDPLSRIVDKALNNEKVNEQLITTLGTLLNLCKGTRDLEYYLDLDRRLTPLVIAKLKLHSLEKQKSAFKVEKKVKKIQDNLEV